MLDIVTTNNKINRSANKVEYRHSTITDLDLYHSEAKFERVPSLVEIDGMINELTDYQAVYNTATRKIVDMRPIPKSYNLIPHEKMLLEHALQFIEQFPEHRTDLSIVDRIFENGKKAHRTIYFDGLKVDVGANDPVTPRIDIYNSIDMSWAFQVFSGAYRSLCQNTLVFGGEKAFHQKRKHTRNLEPTAILNKANVSLDTFLNQREYMRHLKNSHVSEGDFGKFLQFTLCDTSDDKHPNRINNGLHDYLMKLWEEQIVDCGRTGWNAFNVLTHWSTHTLDSPRSRKGHRVHDVQRQRQDVVRELVESDNWRDMLVA